MNGSLLDHLQHFAPQALFTSETLEAGTAAVVQGRTSRPSLGSAAAAAFVADDRLGRCRAELRLTAAGLTATCSCDVPACSHCAALLLLLTGGANPAPPESPGDVGAGTATAAADPQTEERRRRAERARSGLFRVTRPRGCNEAVFGPYDVNSPSGRGYRVTLRALDAAHNSCACQDFATNLLGTCKHIEAVLGHLSSKRALRREVEQARRNGPKHSYLFLAHAPLTEIRLRRGAAEVAVARFARRWYEGDGRPGARCALDAWPELLAEARASGVEVPAEVDRFVARSLEDAARQRRVAAIEAEVRAAGHEQPGFSGRLYPYQVEGVAFLASRGRALLADDMGLGKTAQAIAAMARLFRSGDIARALVVCPTSLKHQWANEIARFTSAPALGTTVIAGSREQREAQYAQAREVVITSYELLRTDEKSIARLAPDLLVLDEAQRIKNWRTRTSDVVKGVPTRLAYVLTGTPLENRLDDLYSLMQVVDPHLLGPLWRFNQDFTQLDERGRVQGYRNLGELRARLRPYFLRRRKEQVLLQLPERIVSRLVVTLDQRQREIHDEAQEVVARILAVLKRRPLSPVEEQRLMRAFQRMRMACDAACLVREDLEAKTSPKLEELERLLDEICLQGGHKVVVFSEWAGMQELAAGVASRLKIKHVRLHGSVPSQKRGALIEQFRADPSCQIFFSTDAGGVGLNLQAADHLINLDLPWNPAVLAQRIGRVHRMGQRNAVNVVIMVADASIERRMEATLEAKRGLFEATVGDDTGTDAIERSGLARRIATLLSESFAAPTGPVPVAPPSAPAGQGAGAEADSTAVDPVRALQAAVGEAGLDRVLRARDGRLVAVVADGAAVPPSDALAQPNLVVLPASAVAAMSAFGDGSPLAGAQVLFEQERQAAADADHARRRSQLSAADGKIRGAVALGAQDLGAEALGLLRDAMMLVCRAAAERDPGEEPAALLSSVFLDLVPTGSLSATEAAALARASELARAFGAATAKPAAALVSGMADEVAAIASRLRGKIGPTEDASPA